MIGKEELQHLCKVKNVIRHGQVTGTTQCTAGTVDAVDAAPTDAASAVQVMFGPEHEASVGRLKVARHSSIAQVPVPLMAMTLIQFLSRTKS